MKLLRNAALRWPALVGYVSTYLPTYVSVVSNALETAEQQNGLGRCTGWGGVGWGVGPTYI